MTEPNLESVDIDEFFNFELDPLLSDFAHDLRDSNSIPRIENVTSKCFVELAKEIARTLKDFPGVSECNLHTLLNTTTKTSNLQTPSEWIKFASEQLTARNPIACFEKVLACMLNTCKYLAISECGSYPSIFWYDNSGSIALCKIRQIVVYQTVLEFLEVPRETWVLFTIKDGSEFLEYTENSSHAHSLDGIYI